MLILTQRKSISTFPKVSNKFEELRLEFLICTVNELWPGWLKVLVDLLTQQ